MKPKIGAYARISFDKNGEELGVSRQHEDNRATADLRGWVVAREYTDNSVSAYKKNVVRPAFEQMVADLQSGEIDGIVAYDLDRLWRKPSDLERVIDIYDTDTRRPFATVQGDYDLSTSDGRTMARIMVAMANKSSSDTSRRIKRQEVQRAEMGLPKKTKRPYGYAVDQIHLDPVEAPLLQEIGRLFVAGCSYREIAWRLNERGDRTRTGAEWYADTIRKFLHRPRNAGFRELHGVTYQGSWEPIFNEDEWSAIRHMVIRRRDNYRGRPSNRRYLLTGLVMCGNCGGYLSGMTKRDSVSKPLRGTYQCASQSDLHRHQGCGGVCVGSVPLDHFIREAICYRLDSNEVGEILEAAKVGTGQLAALLNERDQLEARIGVMRDDYADGTLSKAEFLHTRDRLDARAKVLDSRIDGQRLATFQLDIKPGESARQAWIERPDGWRRELADSLIESIVVNKSAKKPYYEADGQKVRFDALRVEIKWKV